MEAAAAAVAAASASAAAAAAAASASAEAETHDHIHGSLAVRAPVPRCSDGANGASLLSLGGSSEVSIRGLRGILLKSLGISIYILATAFVRMLGYEIVADYRE
ncbi:hypothetical protein GUJ93_ZPchr0011g27779 [Zizania palustris]|uniref:Uncharacterized protein n=1 Tax=Zizania palustris TaxID=103762 RepID=A0A8J6BMA7_ZIZPA|nr:hypothetical protein GUJ93_ZPchr0011g27779 [Zizania palustris]